MSTTKMSSPTSADDDVAGTNCLELTLGAGAPTDAAGAAVRSAAVHSGLHAERSTRLRAVVEELVREARLRECAGSDDEIVVRTLQRGHRFSVQVHDRRLPVAAGGSRSLPSRRLAALGFVDTLHISSHGSDGNVAECELRLDGGAAEVDDSEEVLTARVERATDEESAALEIRAMVPGDAAGIAQCVYRCYGYSYLDPMMYRPSLLRGAARSGLLHSVVAVTPGGEIVGHCALTFDRRGDLVPEGGKLVVDPRYRGHHLAERLAAVRTDEAATLGVEGIWFECVTNHAFSQKEVLAGGGAETGLLIGATPASIHMEALENTVAGRHALLTMWTPVRRSEGSPRDGGGAVVHVPPRHAEMAAQTCGRVGLDRQVVSGSADVDPSGHTLLTSSASSDTGVAHLRIHRIGSDLVERVADELEALAAFDLAAVHLDVTVEDPAASSAIESLESLGFFWGAWLPCFADGSDVLRLQRVVDRPVEVEHIACARPEGEAVRDHVLAEWRRVHRGG